MVFVTYFDSIIARIFRVEIDPKSVYANHGSDHGYAAYHENSNDSVCTRSVSSNFGNMGSTHISAGD